MLRDTVQEKTANSLAVRMLPPSWAPTKFPFLIRIRTWCIPTHTYTHLVQLYGNSWKGIIFILRTQVPRWGRKHRALEVDAVFILILLLTYTWGGEDKKGNWT